MNRKIIEVITDVPAAQDVVFAAMTDWDRQSEWMLGTKVEARERGGIGEGAGIAAFTGIGRLGFWDTMKITRWVQPEVVEVDHTGKLVRGIGVFRVEAVGSRSRFVWREELDLPLGVIGAVGWYLVKPVALVGLKISMRRFARWAAARPASVRSAA